MGALKFGPARIPSRESPEEAIALLQERGYTACEIDFEGRFWMDYPLAERLGALAGDAGIALSVHAPLAGFMGHVERGKKFKMALGMLDHSAGLATPAAPSSSSSTPASCSAARARRRSPPSSSSSASCASGSRRRTASCRSASR